MSRTHLFGIVSAAAFVMSASASFAATYDTATDGNWIGTYGSQGYVLFNYKSTGDSAPAAGAADITRDLNPLPIYISSYSYANASQYTWNDGKDAGTPPLNNLTDTRALQDPADAGHRVAATSYGGGNWSVVLNVAQSTQFKLGVYALDWDNFNSRDITITVNGDAIRINNLDDNLPPADGVDDYRNGTWVQFIVTAPAGPLNIDITQNAANNSNSTLSAITFDAVPEPASLGLAAVAAGGALLRRRRR